jgi:hypothetical protein
MNILIICREEIKGFPKGITQYGNAVIYNGFDSAIQFANSDQEFKEIFLIINNIKYFQEFLELVNCLKAKMIYIITDHENWHEKQQFSAGKVIVIRTSNHTDIFCSQLVADANE